MKRVSITCLLLFVSAITIRATTWNEPWHEEVVKRAESFVKVRITGASPALCKAEVLKSLAGATVPKEFELSGFSLLNVTSTSGDTLELALPFRQNEIYYLLITRNPKTNRYQIPTPSAGWAWLKEGTVRCTYRHSYHQALVPEDVYELTMTAIFDGLHGQSYDRDSVIKFVQEQLSGPVAELGKDDSINKKFFLQHAALETFYFLKQGVELSRLLPFLESKAFHVQVSACRAVSAIDSAAAKETLMKFIESKSNGFAKVMCVWGLKRLKAREMIPRLKTFMDRGEDQNTGFGGDIMDPRVGTFFPASVKAAAWALLNEWGVRVPEPKISIGN
jgi:hypothetical protein